MRLIILMALLLGTGSSFALPNDCVLSDAEWEALLLLDFETLDQTEGQGWRPYWDAGCYRLMGELTAAYIDRHEESFERQPTILIFHAGQGFAAAGEYDCALPLFRRSLGQERVFDPAPQYGSDPYTEQCGEDP